MDGMTILWTEEVAQTGFSLTPAIAFPIVTGVLFLIFIIIGCVKGSGDLLTIGACLFILLIFASVGSLASMNNKIIGYETHYHVIFNEKVDMNELSEKYNIIGQKGIEYTLVEKEN